MKKILLLFFVFLILPLNVLGEEFNLNSKHAILINLNDDSILYEKDMNEKTYIASLTKIMTAVVVLDNVSDLNEKVILEKQDFKDLVKLDAVTSGLKVGKSYTYEELLYGLLVPSGADCANALARLVGKTNDNFIKMMNEKAKELGMENTSFSNTIGLDDENNYSTVYDMSLLFRHAIKNETFSKIVKTMNYTTTDKIKLSHTFNLYMKKGNIKMDYLQGGKTGWDFKAGYCLASLATYNDINYMLITTNAKETPNQFNDAKTIYKYYMDNYNYQILFNEDDIIHSINTKYAKNEKVNIKAKEDYSYYLRNDYDKEKIILKYEGIDTLSYKNKINDKLGTLSIYYEEELLDTIDIFLEEKVTFNLISFIKQEQLISFIIFDLILIVLLVIFIIKRKRIKLRLSE